MGGGVEYAPAAIRGLFDKIKAAIPQAQLSGILGDRAHTYGYHRCRNVLPAGDYSRTLPLDQQGDGWAASALDVTLPDALMPTVTTRLVNAAKARDPRLKAVREFCGTLNGTQTYPWDLAANRSEGVGTWDDSHLWHVHLSIYRAYANDAAALAPIAAVMVGTATPKEDDVSQADVIAALQSAAGKKAIQDAVRGAPIRNSLLDPPRDVALETFVQSINSGVYDLRAKRLNAEAVSEAVKAALPSGIGGDADKIAAEVIAHLASRLEAAGQ